MNDLRNLAALQARVYEFLEQQDEATLQGIVDRTVRLAVLSAGDGRPAPKADQDLSRLNLPQLRALAKERGLKRYSSLTKAKLIALLTGDGPNQTDPPPREPAPREPAPVKEAPQPAEPPKPTAEVAAIAARLREIETEEEGAAYLRAQGLDRVDLLAVATELRLTRVDRLKPAELEKRVLRQAIGARRKFAGLRKW
jgi:Rho termination factor, N-terminal domain